MHTFHSFIIWSHILSKSRCCSHVNWIRKVFSLIIRRVVGIFKHSRGDTKTGEFCYGKNIAVVSPLSAIPINPYVFIMTTVFSVERFRYSASQTCDDRQIIYNFFLGICLANSARVDRFG